MMRLFVSDHAPVLDKVKASPDAKIMNVSGGPSPQNNIPWLVVRLPGRLTVFPYSSSVNEPYPK